MASNDVGSIYSVALHNTHAEEAQGLRQMQNQLAGLENYPEYAQILRDHIPVTEGQLKRLEQAMQAVGTSPSVFKEAVTQTAGTIGAAVHALAKDETLKNLYAGYAYQYHQIAAYRSLIAIAESAGHADHTALFRQSLDEEKRAADRVDGLIEKITRHYVDLTVQGKKADS